MASQEKIEVVGVSDGGGARREFRSFRLSLLSRSVTPTVVSRLSAPHCRACRTGSRRIRLDDNSRIVWRASMRGFKIATNLVLFALNEHQERASSAPQGIFTISCAEVLNIRCVISVVFEQARRNCSAILCDASLLKGSERSAPGGDPRSSPKGSVLGVRFVRAATGRKSYSIEKEPVASPGKSRRNRRDTATASGLIATSRSVFDSRLSSTYR
jgi:hypothetical protein